MAEEKKLKITFKWENNKAFEMTAKLNDNPDISIVKIEENACIKLLWAHIQSICMDYLKHNVNEIGEEMKT